MKRVNIVFPFTCKSVRPFKIQKNCEPSPWKYFTVLTRSSSVASSSTTKIAFGCCWQADTVHMWLTPSSMTLYRASALCAPVMRIKTWERNYGKATIVIKHTGCFCFRVRLGQEMLHKLEVGSHKVQVLCDFAWVSFFWWLCTFTLYIHTHIFVPCLKKTFLWCVCWCVRNYWLFIQYVVACSSDICTMLLCNNYKSRSHLWRRLF